MIDAKMESQVVTSDGFSIFSRWLHREDGLTLIEIMVSMMIFLVVSTGIAGTLTTGLRSTLHARQSTFGKEVAQQRIEEMRSRTYYVPYSSDPQVGTQADYDLLDVYYPGLITSSYQGWSGHYYGGSDAHYTMASPPDIHGVTTTVETRFVNQNRTVIVPPSSYNSNSAVNDIPPSELVMVKVTTSWTDRSGENTYSLESLISSTSQTPPVEENGCEHSSNSRVDVDGLILTTSLGLGEPYIPIVNGKMGDAHASAVYSCNASMLASATGGQISLVADLLNLTGATASVSGPPSNVETAGPITVLPPVLFPKPLLIDSRAKAEVEDDGPLELEAEGEANVGTQSLDLGEIAGVPLNILGLSQWDFVNPSLSVLGAGNGDDGEDVEAEIDQEDGKTRGEAEITYQTINILPLQKWPSWSTVPSAGQGLVFIRNFEAHAEAKANAVPGEATTIMSYSFKLGMFNPTKAGCTGSSTEDACYDLYDISPAFPLQNISLSASAYALQSSLMTEWHSYTPEEIADAMVVSSDGTKATITADALVKISAKFGTEINMDSGSGTVTLVSLQGLQKVWLGAIDISIEQNG